MSSSADLLNVVFEAACFLVDHAHIMLCYTYPLCAVEQWLDMSTTVEQWLRCATRSPKLYVVVQI